MVDEVSLVGEAEEFETPDVVDNTGEEVSDPAEKPGEETPTEEKPVEEKPDDATGEEEKPAGAPEEYEAFQMDEGFELSEEALKEVTELAKELNLTQEQAQTLVNREVKAAADADNSNLEVWEDMQKTWRTDAKNDKEYGGAKFDENVALAKKAVEKFGTPALVSALNDYGFGNNPEFIRTFYRIGKAMSEDQMFTGRGSERTPADPAKVLYPNQN